MFTMPSQDRRPSLMRLNGQQTRTMMSTTSSRIPRQTAHSTSSTDFNPLRSPMADAQSKSFLTKSYPSFSDGSRCIPPMRYVSTCWRWCVTCEYGQARSETRTGSIGRSRRETHGSGRMHYDDTISLALQAKCSKASYGRSFKRVTDRTRNGWKMLRLRRKHAERRGRRREKVAERSKHDAEKCIVRAVWSPGRVLCGTVALTATATATALLGVYTHRIRLDQPAYWSYTTTCYAYRTQRRIQAIV